MMKSKKIKILKEFREFSNLRNIEKMNSFNDGTRTLSESIAVPEVEMALNDWIKNNESDCVLIGGLALSFYMKPRETMDIDVLYLSKNDIPMSMNDFKRTRKSAFQHNRTHVEVELVSPQLINTPVELIQKVFDTSNIIGGIKIASPSALIALKLGRFNLQDQTDIQNLMKYTKIDISEFLQYLSQKDIDNYDISINYFKNQTK